MITIGDLIGLPVVRYWVNLLKVQSAGVLSRHRHPQPVPGYVIKGTRRYLEHDWKTTEGPLMFTRHPGKPPRSWSIPAWRK